MSKILLGFSWGHQFPNPGTSNKVIAKMIEEIRNGFDYVVVQIEIADALKTHGKQADYVVGQPGIYINTYEVAKAMFDWMRGKNLEPAKNEISIVCHKTHWSGCRVVLRELGISAKRIPIDIPYDPNSKQWYTRGPVRAFLGKALHAVGYLLRGELV